MRPGKEIARSTQFFSSLLGITNNRVPNRSQSFTYDQLNRITTAQTSSNYAVDPVNCWSEAFAYDNPQTGTGPLGNLIQINPGGSAYTGCTQESGFSYTVNSNNQISGWCYDASGNLLAESPCGGSSTYSYDAENRLTSTAGVTYEYDGDGKRVSKSSGTLYWYGRTSAPITETDASGNTVDEYVFFGGKRIARVDSVGDVVYYMADHLGTSRVISDPSGTILDDSDFYPFGGERPAIPATSGNTYKFTGKDRDSESGNDYFGARYYSSTTGRFISADPGWFLAADTSNPQTWNQYSYALNNPLRFLDPTGLYCAWEDGTSDDDPADGGIDNNSTNGCEAQGGHWTDDNNPCQGADNCVATFDWNQPYTDNPNLNIDPYAFLSTLAVFGPQVPNNGNKRQIQCTGVGRGLSGNASLVGRQGGIPGQTVQLGTAAVIPPQFGVSTGTALGPFASSIYGTIGSASFSSITDVMGGKSPIQGVNVRTAMQQLFPGQLILEIPGASDQGANAPVTIFVPQELGCPTGTAPRSGGGS